MSGTLDTTPDRPAQRLSSAGPAWRPASLAEQLETGEIARFLPCPVPLPDAETRCYLFEQRSRPSDNVQFCPRSGQLTGMLRRSHDAEERLINVLQTFSDAAVRWLSDLLPEYRREWTPQRVTWRSEEEATRPLSRTVRSDLLQIDAFATPATRGARVLRLFVNLNDADARVWAVSDTFEQLFDRFADKIRGSLEAEGWPDRWRRTFLHWLRRQPAPRSLDFDRFMCALRQRLIRDDDYQEKAVRRLIHFQPGEAWLAFTDGFAHTELRGQYALEHTFFISPHALVRPELAPANLVRGRQASARGRAA